VPSGHRSDKVCHAEEVEGTGHRESGDTIQSREVPCYLRSVDTQMRGYWSVFALGNEDLVRICRRHLFSRYGSTSENISIGQARVLIELDEGGADSTPRLMDVPDLA
jgi:hypothetical protein